MTLRDVNSLVSFILKDIQPDLILVSALFERLLNVAQTKQYMEHLEQFEQTKILSVEMSPFKKNMGEKTSPLSIDKWGYAITPSDFYYPDHIRYRYIKDGQFISFYDVVILDDKNWNDRVGSNLMKPSFNYPIANVQNGYIRFAPLDLKKVIMDYLMFPTYPKYAVSTTKGFQEFDENNSSVWQWKDASTIQIVQKLLAELNLSLTIEQINNQQQKQQQQ